MGNQFKPKQQPKVDSTQIEALDIINRLADNIGEHHQDQIKYPILECPHKFPITAMCINKTCKSEALMCEFPQCKACIPAHTTCGLIKLNAFTSLIEVRNNNHKKLIKQIEDTEFRIFGSLRSRRQVYLQDFFLRGFHQKYTQIVESLFFDGSQLHFTGALAEQFYSKLKESNNEMAEVEAQVLKKFTRQIERTAASLMVLEADVIKKYLERVKLEQFKKPKEAQKRKNYVLDSKIIPPQKKEDIKFIYENLDNPRKVELVFRASENAFQGTLFHEKCDNIPHTLTIIRTEFDKIIAGYTPLTWNITKGVAADQTRLSFLLSVDKKQRMDLIRPQKAIQCLPTEGPIFGGGSDLAIVNECHIKNNCTYFPYSYNYKYSDINQKYQYNQAAWTALTGAPNGKFFKVLEYEVYKIEWD